jgi:plasmid rolling circle replication initiator protein Rep
MPDNVSDRGINAASSLPFQSKSEQDIDAPGLEELSPRDKPWNKHRANADKVAVYYEEGDYLRYAQRVNTCSELLDFRLVPEASEGLLKLKLSSAKFCRVRHCPVCQWRRSLMWKAKAYKILPRVVAAFPKYRWLFLTLTLKNCNLSELRSTLNFVNKAFKRLTELKAWPAEGWIKSVEVTRGKDGSSAHPHIHCLLMVPSSYFSGRDYLSQARWVELWQRCLRVDYKPILDVQAIKPKQSPVALVPEILKYQTKESDLVADREWFLEYQRQMHKTRAIAVGGILRDYMRELEAEPDDLVGEDNEGEVDEGHLYFGWKRKLKKYKLVE